MLVQAFRFLGLLFTALILGAAFCHVLEMPLKMALPPQEYIASGVRSNFESLRNRWEWGHTIHAGLLFTAFVALLVSVLADIPRRGLAAVAARRSPQGRAA